MVFTAIFFIIACIIILIPVAVVLHELGHAIPLVLMTKQSTTVYVGSYGKTQKSFRLKVGLITFYWYYYPEYKGLCVPSGKLVSLNKQLLYILMGPLVSLIVTIFSFLAFLIWEPEGLPQFILIIFIVLNLLGFFGSIIPRNKPTLMEGGQIVYNDGMRMIQLLQFKRMSKECLQAYSLYEEKSYGEAAIELEKIIAGGDRSDHICRLLFYSHFQNKKYQDAIKSADMYMEEKKLTSNDLVNIGLAYTFLEQHENAFELYDRSLNLNPANKFALNNKGYSLNVCNRFSDAIPLLDRAIEIDSHFAHAYNNKGLAQIKLGQLDAGLKNIQHAISLDNTNSYAYRNLGIYHLEKKEYKQALDLFKKSESIDPATHMIKELIKQAESLQG